MGKVKIAMDCAASEFYDGASKTYDLAFKSKVCGGWFGGGGLGVGGRFLAVLRLVLCLLGSCARRWAF